MVVRGLAVARRGRRRIWMMDFMMMSYDCYVELMEGEDGR